MSILGVCGLARSGKDTFFRFADELGIRCARLAFADALKQECNSFLIENTGLSSFTKDKAEKEVIRPFLVTYGTHLRRKLDPECWIKIVNQKAEYLTSNEILVIVTDVRYPNEAEWIHESGGKLVHITRTVEGVPLKPPNEEEELNDPILKTTSDYLLEWSTFDGDLEQCKPLVQKCLKQLQITN